jgi:hypothetical protein
MQIAGYMYILYTVCINELYADQNATCVRHAQLPTILFHVQGSLILHF